MSTGHGARAELPLAACAILWLLTGGAAGAAADPVEPLAVSEITARNAAAVVVIRARAAPDVRTLQISAAISGGSSGAPVFDRSSAVVGMAVAAAAYGALDLNLAIPAERIAPLIDRDLGLTLATLEREVDRDREQSCAASPT